MRSSSWVRHVPMGVVLKSEFASERIRLQPALERSIAQKILGTDELEPLAIEVLLREAVEVLEGVVTIFSKSLKNECHT